MSRPILQINALGIQLSGHDILKNVSLSVNRGEYVSIIGPNGAGKTTLIKCIAGIHRNWTGTIRIADKPFSGHKARELAKIQSYVPQAEGRSIPFTIEEFVAMGRYPHLSTFTTLTPEDHQAIDTAIEKAGLQPLRHRAMNTLSGGERQMAFIASALAQGADLLLLDEPSTFLDYRHQTNVSTLLKSSCRENGITVVAVHHDINTATASSDRIYAIKEGVIAFEGTPEETADASALKTIYGTDFIVSPLPHRPLPYIIAGGAR